MSNSVYLNTNCGCVDCSIFAYLAILYFDYMMRVIFMCAYT